MKEFRSWRRARACRALALGTSSVGVLAVLASAGPVQAQPVASGTPSCATVAGSADWPAARHDMARTGANTGETTLAPSNVSRLVSVARLPISNLVLAEPIVAGNRAYIASSNSRLFTASATSLTLRWQTRLALRPGPADYDDAAPVCAEGGLFATAESSRQAESLDPVDGSTRWRTTVSWDDVKASPAVDGGSVFVAARAGELTALDAATGAIRWQVVKAHDVTVGDLWSSPAVQDGKVYIGAEKLFAYDETTGRRLLAAPFRDSGDYTANPPVLYGNAVLVDSDHAVTSFDPTSGAIRWSVPLVYGDTDRPLAAADGRVFAVQGQKSIVALSARTGRKLWQFTAPAKKYEYMAAPVYANGVVYVPGPEHFYALDASTGAVLWTSGGFDFEIPLTVTVADGTLYTTDYENGVYAWRLGTGDRAAGVPVAGVHAATRLRLLRERAAARMALRQAGRAH